MKKNSGLVIVLFLIIILGVIYGVLLLTKYNIIFKKEESKPTTNVITDKDKETFINDLNEYTEFALNRYNEDMAIGNNSICYTISFYDNLMHKDDSKYEGRIIYAVNKIDDKYEVIDQRVYFTNKKIMITNINVLSENINLKDSIKSYSSDEWNYYGYNSCDEYMPSLNDANEQ